MTKIAIVIGAIVMLAGVATAGTVTGLGTDEVSPTVSIPDDTVSVGETTVSVPDDTVSVGETTVSVPDGNVTTETGEDISGPCDEAEHAGDPRCTGVRQARDDRRGRGRDDRRDDRREDRSGPSENSGPGSSGRDDRHEGGGGGDNSGPGGGGNSGRGGGDD